MVALMKKKQIFMSTMLFGFCGVIQMGTTEVSSAQHAEYAINSASRLGFPFVGRNEAI
jgi:fatty-acid desaturase